MKIIVKNQHGSPVFTFDVEKREASVTDTVSMNRVALEFLRGLETVVMYNSQYKDGGTIQDFLIEAGRGSNSGDFTIAMGAEGPLGQKGGNIDVTNPGKPAMKKCTECVDGIQTLAYSTGPCTTCHGNSEVPA